MSLPFGLESPPVADDVRACAQAMLQKAKSLGKCALIVVVSPLMPLPDHDARAVIQAEVQKLDPYVICGATVISDPGLAGSAKRAVVSTMQLITRPRHREKIVGTSMDAGRFVASELLRVDPSSPTTTAIAAMVDRATKSAWGGT
ncbi:MAG: hypothetical protein IPK82_24370 [Polyangiaceae bacterium]|nr:hypothetical protein [Polyangiaceae bacterium]